MQEAKTKAAALESAGVEQVALDQCAHEGLANGAFEADDEEEVFMKEFIGDKNESVAAQEVSNNGTHRVEANGQQP